MRTVEIESPLSKFAIITGRGYSPLRRDLASVKPSGGCLRMRRYPSFNINSTLSLDDFSVLTHFDSLEQAILNAINTQPDIRLGIVFGSLASGAGRMDSDLDLAVDAGRQLAASEKIALISELAARTGRPIDLVDLHEVGEPLLGQILQHGKRILGTDTQYGNLIRRHVFDQADFLPYRNRILAERRRAWIGK